jgi:hypothetical protein
MLWQACNVIISVGGFMYSRKRLTPASFEEANHGNLEFLELPPH